MQNDIPQSHLRRLGAQTIARFLVCMLVMELKVARCERCLMRYSRVLWKKGQIFNTHFKKATFSNHCFLAIIKLTFGI